MKAVSLVLLSLAAAAVAAATPVNELDTETRTFSFKDKQVLLLKLVDHILQPNMYNEIEDLGKDFKFDANIDRFAKTDVVKKFMGMMKFGLLPKGEVFSLHINRQLEEVVTAFHLLYYAKDFTTFAAAASWMRLNLNEGMFVYALTVACRHRDDCKGVILPAPYEIYPYYYLRADVIQKAYLLKMKNGLLDPKLCELYGIAKDNNDGVGDVYVIDENVYDTRFYLNDDDRLRYFTEDIDLNTYFYYFHVDYPFWMKDIVFDKLKFRRGELNLYMYQQLLARHYLERLSNGLGEVETLSLVKPIKSGVFPWMLLHNGIQLPARHNNFVLARDHADNIELLRFVDDVESIFKEAIIKGYIEVRGVRLELNKPEDVETLGKLVFAKVDKSNVDKTRVYAYRYLDLVLKAVLGFNSLTADKYFVTPTLLDSFETALRDPVFYQLQKRLCDLLILFKLRLPSYTREEVLFPGVKIDKVVVEKLETFFADYYLDITNAIMLTDEELKKKNSNMIIVARKKLLNHNDFSVTLEIDSDKAVDSVVRVFLGPKRDHLERLIDLNRNRLNFVELDSFLFKLQTGKNTIVRRSQEMHNVEPDRIKTRELWHIINNHGDIENKLRTEMKNYNTGFPRRLLLPKGHISGMNMMLYVIVTPLKLVEDVDHDLNLDTTRVEKERRVERSTVLLDKMPLGFPLDRHIDVTQFFVPNMKFVDVKVFHRIERCNMRDRWEKYVLREYDMDQTNWEKA